FSVSAGDSAGFVPALPSPTSARCGSKPSFSCPRWRLECFSRNGSAERTNKIGRIDHEHEYEYDVMALIRCSAFDVRCFLPSTLQHPIRHVLLIFGVRCSTFGVRCLLRP